MIASLRPTAAFIADQAAFVTIRKDLIPEYTADLLAKYPLITKMDDNHFLSAAYVLALDSINFGSAWFDDKLSYVTVAKGLKNAFLLGEMNTAEKWRAATPETCSQVFSLPLQGYAEILGLYAHHLQAAGSIVKDFYDGDVMNLLEEAQGSAVRLVNIVGKWPSFHDVAAYKNQQVPFLKRAQILAADMYLTLEGAGLGAFHDMDQLTIFADNMIPHVLRHDGILEYAPSLAQKIDSGQEILPGSAEETEIRATAIHAVELMRESAGGRVTSVNLDHILWNRGSEPALDAAPLHRTKTAWY